MNGLSPNGCQAVFDILMGSAACQAPDLSWVWAKPLRAVLISQLEIAKSSGVTPAKPFGAALIVLGLVKEDVVELRPPYAHFNHIKAHPAARVEEPQARFRRLDCSWGFPRLVTAPNPTFPRQVWLSRRANCGMEWSRDRSK